MTSFSKLAIIIFSILLFACGNNHDEIKIGSKKFTESVILGEIVTLLASTEGVKTEYREQLGGTRILWNALLGGEIDIYPEYTGTITQEILSDRNITNSEQLHEELGQYGIEMSQPLGFNNTYALGMMRGKADKLGIETISDLRNHPELKFGFTNEFLDRSDGWPSLQKTYQLPQKNVTGLDHDLAYRGLESGHIDVTDLYSTDAEIEYYDLKILNDDRKLFKDYFAVLLYRKDLRDKYPEALNNILKLQNSITEQEMISMNADSKIKSMSNSVIASDFHRRDKFGIETNPDTQRRLSTGFTITLFSTCSL